MTVSAAASRNDYVGTGLVDTYSYSFRITSAADLLVTTRDTDGLETTLTYPTDYSVTGVGVFSGGTITLTAGALASGYALTIRDDPTVQQDTDLRNQAAPYQEALEDALDYVTRVVKSQADVLDRALTLSETTTGVSAELPSPNAGYALVWNATEDGLQNAIPAGAPTSAFMATLLDDADAIEARTTLGVPAADDGAHTGTTSVQTIAASVAATAPTVATTDNSNAVATTAFVRALLVGEIIFVPRATAPDGTVKANGALLSRTTYAALWAFAQASGNLAASDAAWTGNPGKFSPGDGSTTFRIPDLRGLVVRGHHDGSGTYETDTGRGLGSYQADGNKAHNHLTVWGGSAPYGQTTPNETTGATYTATGQNQTYTSTEGGAETRMRNVSLLPCIRY